MKFFISYTYRMHDALRFANDIIDEQTLQSIEDIWNLEYEIQDRNKPNMKEVKILNITRINP